MQDKAFYFSIAELYIMLGLSGRSECSILIEEEEPSDNALICAFASLFQRRMLKQKGKHFEVCGTGNLFRQIHQAPYAVLISGGVPFGCIAVCYTGLEQAWLLETVDVILERQYRIMHMDKAGFENWLIGTGMLSPPLMALKDVLEYSEDLLENTNKSESQVLLRLEKYRNGGGLFHSYEVCSGIYGQVIRCGMTGSWESTPYTKEAVSQMLDECLGGKIHDSNQRKGPCAGKGI